MSSMRLPICSPKCSPYQLTFIPYALANVVILSPLYVGQTGLTLNSKNWSFCFCYGELLQFQLFLESWAIIKLACCKNKKVELVELLKSCWMDQPFSALQCSSMCMLPQWL
jgi:hypothetical protein